jgi:hypothetical protein
MKEKAFVTDVKNYIKPPKLNPGDTIATVSPAWGCAGDNDTRWRYDLGVKRLKDEFGLIAKPMPYSLRSADYLSKIRKHEPRI